MVLEHQRQRLFAQAPAGADVAQRHRNVAEHLDGDDQRLPDRDFQDRHGQPGERAAPRRAGPVEAAERCGRELSDGGDLILGFRDRYGDMTLHPPAHAVVTDRDYL